MYIVQCIDYIGYSTRTLCAVCEECSVFRYTLQIYGRSVRGKYKEYRVHRPFIRKAILWSVLWAALKTSARAKSKICNIYAVQCT